MNIIFEENWKKNGYEGKKGYPNVILIGVIIVGHFFEFSFFWNTCSLQVLHNLWVLEQSL